MPVDQYDLVASDLNVRAPALPIRTVTSNCVVQESSIRCNLVTQEPLGKLPVVRLPRKGGEVLINKLFAPGIKLQATVNRVRPVQGCQVDSFGAGRKPEHLLFPVVEATGTGLGDAHAEAFHTAKRRTLVKVEGVCLALVT